MLRFLLTLFVLLATLGGIFSLVSFSEKKPAPVATVPTNFLECVTLGFPVRESYPRTCQGTSGGVFTEDIGNVLEKADQILITNPVPDQKIQSPLHVEGQARGLWFFEGSFGVRLLDASGKEVAQKGAEAQGEWMTEEFVPFKATLSFPDDVTGEGMLLLEKANPSGLPEKDDAVRIPVSFSHP